MIPEPEYTVPGDDELLARVAPDLRRLLASDAVDEEHPDLFGRIVAALRVVVESDLARQRAAHGAALDAIPPRLRADVEAAEKELGDARSAQDAARARAEELRARVSDADPHGTRT